MVQMRLAESVRAAVDALELTPADQGAAALAIVYAAAVDAGAVELYKAGPQLLAVLESLLMTPRARAAAVKGAPGASPAASPLDELRPRRAGRHGDAAAVDPAAP